MIRRTLREGFPSLKDLQVGQAFVLLELRDDQSLRVAEIILREVSHLGPGRVELHMFIIFSSDNRALPSGQAIKRLLDLDKQEKALNWTLAPMM